MDYADNVSQNGTCTCTHSYHIPSVLLSLLHQRWQHSPPPAPAAAEALWPPVSSSPPNLAAAMPYHTADLPGEPVLA